MGTLICWTCISICGIVEFFFINSTIRHLFIDQFQSDFDDRVRLSLWLWLRRDVEHPEIRKSGEEHQKQGRCESGQVFEGRCRAPRKNSRVGSGIVGIQTGKTDDRRGWPRSGQWHVLWEFVSECMSRTSQFVFFHITGSDKKRYVNPHHCAYYVTSTDVTYIHCPPFSW